MKDVHADQKYSLLHLNRAYTGAWLLALTIQYFIIEMFARLAWVLPPYSPQYNTISDLGMTTCKYFPYLSKTFVCSPLHPVMNSSFVLNGFLTIAGIYLLYEILPKTNAIRTGIFFLIVSALGLIGVGLFPEDVNFVVHLISAITLLVCGNIALLFFGISFLRKKAWRAYGLYTLAAGVIGLAAFLMIYVGYLPFVGIGLMERFSAYPLHSWPIVTGIVFIALINAQRDYLMS